jgi:hypothetical protein
MSQNSLVQDCETFRQSVMLSINNLDVDEEQKQVFLMSHQLFYMQLLKQLLDKKNTASESHSIVEIVN